VCDIPRWPARVTVTVSLQCVTMLCVYHNILCTHAHMPPRNIACCVIVSYRCLHACPPVLCLPASLYAMPRSPRRVCMLACYCCALPHLSATRCTHSLLQRTYAPPPRRNTPSHCRAASPLLLCLYAAAALFVIAVRTPDYVPCHVAIAVPACAAPYVLPACISPRCATRGYIAALVADMPLANIYTRVILSRQPDTTSSSCTCHHR